MAPQSEHQQIVFQHRGEYHLTETGNTEKICLKKKHIIFFKYFFHIFFLFIKIDF